MEGNNQFNDWWAWEQAAKVPEASGIACDHYHRFESDLDLAKALGHNAYRFSLEWSRIEPTPGEYSKEALDHYAKVIQACRQRNLEPVVTLHHFTLPQWLADKGGWVLSNSVKAFARYVEVVAQRLSQDIRWWVTLNEPTVLIYQGYLIGLWPPGRKGDFIRANLAMRNLAKAHRLAYGIIHRVVARLKGPLPKVGFSHHMICYAPCDPSSRQDRWATRVRDHLANERFLQSCRGAIDFVGLNYYTRDFVHGAGWGLPPRFYPEMSRRLAGLPLMGRICSLEHHQDVGPRNPLGWEIYPEGLRRTLLKLKELGLPILITENGVCTDDDRVRGRFIEEHLKETALAMDQGAQVIGYLYWALIDNFEWAHGFGPRFGLVEVDYTTLERRVRPSALKLAQMIRGMV